MSARLQFVLVQNLDRAEQLKLAGNELYGKGQHLAALVSCPVLGAAISRIRLCKSFPILGHHTYLARFASIRDLQKVLYHI